MLAPSAPVSYPHSAQTTAASLAGASNTANSSAANRADVFFMSLPWVVVRFPGFDVQFAAHDLRNLRADPAAFQRAHARERQDTPVQVVEVEERLVDLGQDSRLLAVVQAREPVAGDEREQGFVGADHANSLSCADAAEMRWQAISKYLGSISMPINLKPSSAAAQPVEPEPQRDRGSPRPVASTSRHGYRISSVGFTVGCVLPLSRSPTCSRLAV